MRRAFVSLTLAAALGAALLAACGNATEPADNNTAPTFSISPTSFTFVVGDSSTISVLSTREGTVRWQSSNAAVVVVDTLVQVGDPARVRARASGSATLGGTIRISGQTFSVTVPVRVGSG